MTVKAWHIAAALVAALLLKKKPSAVEPPIVMPIREIVDWINAPPVPIATPVPIDYTPVPPDMQDEIDRLRRELLEPVSYPWSGYEITGRPGLPSGGTLLGWRDDIMFFRGESGAEYWRISGPSGVPLAGQLAPWEWTSYV